MKKKIWVSIGVIFALACLCFGIVIGVLSCKGKNNEETNNANAAKIVGVWEIVEKTDKNGVAEPTAIGGTFEFTADNKMYNVTRPVALFQASYVWKGETKINLVYDMKEEVDTLNFTFGENELSFKNETTGDSYKLKKWVDTYDALRAKVAGNWTVSKSTDKITGAELPEDAGLKFILSADGKYEGKKAESTTLGSYRIVDESHLLVVMNGQGGRLVGMQFADDYTMVMDDYYFNKHMLATKEGAGEAYVSPYQSALVGSWTVEKSVLASSGDEITVPAMSFAFTDTFTYTITRDGNTASGTYRWKSASEFADITDLSRVFKLSFTSEGYVSVEDVSNNQAYILSYNSAKNAALLGTWTVVKQIAVDGTESTRDAQFTFGDNYAFSCVMGGSPVAQMGDGYRWVTATSIKILNNAWGDIYNVSVEEDGTVIFEKQADGTKFIIEKI